MTEEEAYEFIDKFPRCHLCDDSYPFGCDECDEAFKTALNALKQPKRKNEQRFFVDKSGKITPLPTVVRCKDCRYYEPTPAKDEPDRGWCNGRCSDLPAVHGAWFCADGKRKEGGEQDG